MTNTAAHGINPVQPSKRKNSWMIKETLLFLLLTAFLLLVVATVTNVRGLARLSAISATLFSLPSQNYQHQEAANPTGKLSLNKTHIDSSSVNLVLKENPKIENLLPGWSKNSSETYEFAKSGDIEVSKSHNTATPSLLPAFQAGNKPLLCSNNSGIPCFTPPWDSPEFSIQTQEPLLINHGTTQLPSPPPESAIVPRNKIDQGHELDHSLERTADENKTVIIITLNSAWAEKGSMIDLFLESFRIGEGTKDLLDHLLVVAVDAKAYDRCVKIHPHCYILRTQGVDFSAEKTYMTQDYLKMMWRRLEFLGDVLKRGYNFVFSDTDIMWLRNPFPIFSGDADFQIASDFFFGNPEDTRNRPNCGFKFVRSNDKTITFYQNWYRSRLRYPGKNEQDVINILKVQSSFKELNMKFMFLDTKNFGGFCVRSPYIDEAYTMTMHATCCKGLKAKLIDLRTALDEFISSRKNVTLKLQGTRVKWSAPKACPRSWSH